MELLLLQKPIVIEMVRQPAATPEITITDVIVGALGTAGLIMILAALAGLIAGGIIIYAKKRAAEHTSPHETSHARLGL